MTTSSTFSGTPTQSSISFSDLFTRCEISLNDETSATWDTEMIANWINDAIRDYSQHFPRIRTQTISCAAGDQEYDLNADFLAVLSVEYPVGEDPRVFLSRLAFQHPDLQSGVFWYDIVSRLDDTNQSELWISAEPAAGETISIEYHAHHALMDDPASPSGESSVPPTHQHLLVKYVLWQATLHLMFAEQQSPTSSSSLLMAQLSQNARRLESAYHTAVRQALYAADGCSQSTPWIATGDLHARIY